MRRTLSVSERRACRALGQHRSTQRKIPRGRDDEAQLTADIIELARRYGRCGYRKITTMLQDAGWLVDEKRVERIWRRKVLRSPEIICGRTGSDALFGSQNIGPPGP